MQYRWYSFANLVTPVNFDLKLKEWLEWNWLYTGLKKIALQNTELYLKQARIQTKFERINGIG